MYYDFIIDYNQFNNNNNNHLQQHHHRRYGWFIRSFVLIITRTILRIKNEDKNQDTSCYDDNEDENDEDEDEERVVSLLICSSRVEWSGVASDDRGRGNYQVINNSDGPVEIRICVLLSIPYGSQFHSIHVIWVGVKWSWVDCGTTTSSLLPSWNKIRHATIRLP